MAEVQLVNVSKVFPGRVTAVDNLSLTIGDGEFIVLVGPSGCGKSTTLRMIAGLEDPTHGTIHIGDRVVNDLHPKDRDIAMVFQNYALYPHMTAYRNMAFGLKLRRLPKAEIDRRVRETAETLGITELLARRPKALSGGQRQRVAVGRAIVRDPQCFLFDEPLSNLDVKLRVQMRAELKALHLRLKTTTVYVTHDQEEAMTLGDRIAVMSDGLIQQIAAPLDVYRHPANRFVAGFVGMPPMNFIDGVIERREGRMCFEADGDVRIVVPSGIEGDVTSRLGMPVVLGVRPEGLPLFEPTPGAGEADGSMLSLRVRVTEPLGDAIDIYGSTAAGADIVARVAASAHCQPGDEAQFRVRPSAMHFFEPGEFGRNLVNADSDDGVSGKSATPAPDAATDS